MRVSDTEIVDVKLVHLDRFADERGHFFETFHTRKFAELGLPTDFRQDNQSRSKRDVLRGLHYQLTQPQGKLVRCIRGEIFDVAADIRMDSPTFGKWVGVRLVEDEPTLLWIPPGFAHGFCVLSDVADIQYKCTDLYAREDDRGILWNDSQLSIAWPVKMPLLSDRDRKLPTLTAAREFLPRYSGAATARA